MKTILRIFTAVFWSFALIAGEVALFKDKAGNIHPGRMVIYGLVFLVIAVIIYDVWENTSDQNDEKMEM